MSASLVRCPVCQLTTTSCILLLSHLSQVHDVSFLCYLCLHTFDNIRQLVGQIDLLLNFLAERNAEIIYYKFLFLRRITSSTATPA